MTMTRRNMLLCGGAGIAVLGGAALLTGHPPELPPARVFAVDGLAIRGTDPVAYFTESGPVIGDTNIWHDWAGARWTFADMQHRDMFAADPTAYAPQYGGFCAWAVAEKGQLFSTQPRNWAIVDGRLYLNFNDSVQETWNTDPEGFIARGDQRWPEIVAQA